MGWINSQSHSSVGLRSNDTANLSKQILSTPSEVQHMYKSHDPLNQSKSLLPFFSSPSFFSSFSLPSFLIFNSLSCSSLFKALSSRFIVSPLLFCAHSLIEPLLCVTPGKSPLIGDSFSSLSRFPFSASWASTPPCSIVACASVFCCVMELCKASTCVATFAEFLSLSPVSPV